MPIDIDDIERRTYSRHRSAQLLEGIFGSVVFASADIAVKGLDASTLFVVLLTTAQGGTQLLSLVASKPLAFLGRRNTLRVGALVGRLPLLLVSIFASPWVFFGVLAWQGVSLVLVQTSWNSLLRTNYRDDHRGVLFARANRWGVLAGGIASVGLGFWLGSDPEAFKIAYPIAVVLGLLSCFIFAKIDVREKGIGESDAPSLGLKDLVRLLGRDRNFLTYEIGFMLYGIAFMAAMTAKPLRFAGELDLSYPVILGSKAFFSAFMVLGMFVWGRVIDRSGPAGLKRRANTILVVASVLFFFATDYRLLFVADAVLGFAMAGVHIGWNLGPVTLAPTAALAASYMQLHIAGVGVRAMIGNPVAGVLTEYVGSKWVFLFSAAVFALGAIVQGRLERRILAERAEAASSSSKDAPAASPG